MDAIDVKHEYFTCHQVENMAVLNVNKGTKKFFTSVGGKEALISTLQTIGGAKTIEFTPKELFDLRLISKIVSAEELESTCLQQLDKLTQIPRHAIASARHLLQPNIDDLFKHIDASFESGLRNVYEAKT